MNIFWLAAAALLAFLSIAHAFWGERKIFPLLTPNTVNRETYISLYVPWHQMTYVLFASAVALLLAATRVELNVLPYFVLALIGGNLIIFVTICIVKGYRELFARTLPQTILFLALIGLMVLGIVSG